MPALVRRSFVLFLVLASGAGLLVFGAFGLVGALDDAAERAEEDARFAEDGLRRVAIGLAATIRRELQDPAVLDSVDPWRRFRLESDVARLIRDEDVVAFEDLGVAPEAVLPVDVRIALHAARRAEVDDPRGALESLRTLGGLELLTDQNRAHLWVQAAWVAHRIGDRVACGECLDTAGLLSTDPQRAYASVAAGLVLLAARYDRPVQTGWVERLVALDDEVADALVEELREVGSDAVATRVVERLQRARTVRGTAAEVYAWLAAGGSSDESADVTSGVIDPSRLVIWHPSRREGALMESRAFAEFAMSIVQPDPLAGVVPDIGLSLARGDALGALDVELVAGHSALTVAPRWASVSVGGAAGVASVLVALAMCFVAGLVAMFRAVRAETAAARARSEFLQSVTHELKTPLASIRLLAERLESGRVDGDRTHDYHGMLADEATRLSVLIDNVLDLGRIERGERAYDRRRQDLSSILEEAVDVFSPLAQRDGLALEVDVEAARGSLVAVDRGAIMQALLNVLENARKYAKEGRRVVVRAAATAGEVVLDVRDFGPGIEAAEREAVFERFRRGDRRQSGSISGVGLGLHLSRSIVRAHGGSMVCIAPEDGGSGVTFRMQLPIVDGDESMEFAS